VSIRKPIVVHSRKAEKDTLEILKANVPSDWPIHIHCFTESAQFATSLLKDFKNLYFGFTGIITLKNAGKFPWIHQHNKIQ
jgi:TatD DNase family protein